MKNISKLLQKASQTIDSRDARILLAHVLSCSPTYLHTFPEQEIKIEQEKAFDELISRRQKGEPIAYLTGQQEFWSLPLTVTPDVLIPRPETELLVEQILKRYGDRATLSLLDLGTGSGAIALALAHEKPHWKITASDRSCKALAIAQHNCQKLEIENIHFEHSDWLSKITGTFDVIVSNPPYIAPDDLHLDALHFEPQEALIAEEDGFRCFKTIAEQAPVFLGSASVCFGSKFSAARGTSGSHCQKNKWRHDSFSKPGGALFFEHGYNQALEVQAILKAHGFSQIETFKDLAGIDRVTVGVLSET